MHFIQIKILRLKYFKKFSIIVIFLKNLTEKKINKKKITMEDARININIISSWVNKIKHALITPSKINPKKPKILSMAIERLFLILLFFDKLDT